MNLVGQLAVVTGGGSGIGRATTQVLAALGATVAVADMNLDGASETVSLVEREGGRAIAFPVDVTQAEEVTRLSAQIERSLGRASILVNAAGWDRSEQFQDNSPDYWEKLVQINYLGPVRVTRAFLDGMVTAGRGSIVNVASDAGRVGSSGEAVYAGAKGGVIAFTKSLAREVARFGIRANCVCPGPTDTPLFRAQPERLQEALVRAVPFRRLAEPSEVGDVIAFFASERSTFVTGQVLSVSGGLTMAG